MENNLDNLIGFIAAMFSFAGIIYIWAFAAMQIRKSKREKYRRESQQKRRRAERDQKLVDAYRARRTTVGIASSVTSAAAHGRNDEREWVASLSDN